MSAVLIGSWSIPVIPEGWEAVEQNGIRRVGQESYCTNAAFVEEPLAPGKDLAGYISDQLNSLRGLVSDVQVSGPRQSQFPECDEAQQMVLRYTLDGCRIIQGQVYVLRNETVGVLTYTTVEEEIDAFRSVFNIISGSARFCPRPPAAPDKENKPGN
jgi:hypothetical protein